VRRTSQDNQEATLAILQQEQLTQWPVHVVSRAQGSNFCPVITTKFVKQVKVKANCMKNVIVNTARRGQTIDMKD